MDAAAQNQLPRHRSRVEKGIEISCIMWCLTWSMLVPAFIFFYGIFFVFDQSFGQAPHYAVAIDSVSGLDPLLAGGWSAPAALDLQFNLTVRVASQGFWVRECAGAGIHAEVSYHGVRLASTAATTEKTICAGPRTAVDRPLVARGAGVVVPGSVLDNLATDMLNGVQVFDVELHGSRKDASWMCGPRLVGAGCALEMYCP